MIYNWLRLEKELEVKYKNLYSYYPEEYHKTSEKVNIKCNTCNNIFQETIQRHLKGKKCNCCAPKNKKGIKLSLVEVEERLNNTIPFHRYDISTYTKMREPMKFYCETHGEFWQRPNLKITLYQGCPKCSKSNNNRRLLSLEQVKDTLDSQEIFYEYDISTFSGVLKKMKFFCKIHGEFWQSYLNRSVNKKCLKCSRIEQPLKKRFSIEKVKNRIKAAHNFEPVMETYKSINEPMKFICKTHGEFWQRPNLQFSQNQGCPKCKSNKKEEFLLEIFKEYQINYIYNDRNLIKPLEIDILIPDFNFGVEHNGLFFHSFGINNWSATNNYHLLNKNRHLEKTIKMEEQDYQLFHIREDHLLDSKKKEIWKSVLLNKCGISYKMHARKLQVINLNDHQDFVKDFLEENHLQGSCPASIKLGLQDSKTGIVYSIMTFGKSRFDKNIEYELLRFCNLRYHNVRGAASKLLKTFERIYKPNSIVSYANRDWSQGGLYNCLGFTKINQTPPNYFYVDSNLKTYSRLSAQKHKLKNLLNENFNENLSERDNMINNGYRIYYDTGNLVYHKKY